MPPKIVVIDRATVEADGATRVTVGADEEPACWAFGIAAMDEGYAVDIDGDSGAPRIHLFEMSGNAFAGDIVIPAGLTLEAGPSKSLHSAAGYLSLTFRDGEGLAGWLDAACSGE